MGLTGHHEQGGDDTFGSFPEHIRALISHALPHVDVLALTYPKFETRGELKDCVARFREWYGVHGPNPCINPDVDGGLICATCADRLQNKVIDLEVANSTPSPTIDPSVHTILVGHSMGGIVAAETLLLLDSEQPIPPSRTSTNPEAPNFPSNNTLRSSTSTSHPNPSEASSGHQSGISDYTFMFPHIQGVLAFDTPLLGLAPGMVAHSIEGGHKMVSSAYNTLSEISSAFGWGSKSEPARSSATGTSKPLAALTAPSNDDAAAAPKWQSWGKYAMFAGAAGAVAAGGAAALYSQREKISAGWGWASGHLLFVNCLGRPEELRKRVAKIDETCENRGIGSANFYTNLGKGAREGYGATSGVLGKERTFCNLPTAVREGKDQGGRPGLKWHKAVNEKSTDETLAHISMFFPRDNPGFYSLGERAKEVVVSWINRGWYESSDARPMEQSRGATLGEIGEGWEKPDYGSEDVQAKLHDQREQQAKFAEDDWEGLEATQNSDQEDDDGDHDVKMRDEVIDEDDDGDEQKQELQSSVIVDKAGRGHIPLPTSP